MSDDRLDFSDLNPVHRADMRNQPEVGGFIRLAPITTASQFHSPFLSGDGIPRPVIQAGPKLIPIKHHFDNDLLCSSFWHQA